MEEHQHSEIWENQAPITDGSHTREECIIHSSSAEPLESHFAAEEDVAPKSSDKNIDSSTIETADLLNEDDLATTPRSEVPSCFPTPAALEEVRARSDPYSLSGNGYFSVKTFGGSIVPYTNDSTAVSSVSSPLQSAYASSTSLKSIHDRAKGTQSSDDLSAKRPSASRDVSSASTQTITGPVIEVSDQASTSASEYPRQAVRSRLREGPNYPNQSFAALQYQYHPTPYQPHPLRTRSSHPSHHTSYSSGSSKTAQDRSSAASGSKTAGHTPVQSPGLYSPASSRNQDEGTGSDDGHYSTPSLHPSHLQTPIETHKLLKDVDPISGRKLVNNYEFVKKLGSGTHGTVKLARDLQTNEYRAIKIVRRFSKKLRLGKHETPEDKVKKEVAVLKKARHPHVVSLLEVIDDQEFGKVYLILEFVERGEIVWRKQTDKAIATFEMNRVRREMSESINEEQEHEELVAFNQNATARRIEKQSMLIERRRQATEHLSNEGIDFVGQGTDAVRSPFWSLEYGGEGEEDLPLYEYSDRTESNAAESAKTEAYASRWDHTASVLPVHLSHSTASFDSAQSKEPLETSRTDNTVADGILGESRSQTPTTPLESSIWGTQSIEDPVAHDTYSMLQSTLNRIIEEQTQWTEEEEEYMYVPCLTISQALEAFRDTVLGLEYLHFQGIIHRDIKPANLLWTGDHRVKISDFGVSYLGRPIREDENKEEIPEADSANLDEAIELAKTVGTPAFYAPELCDPALYDSARTSERPQITGQIDVWALGVTLYGMVYGRLPFFDVNEFKMYEKIAGQEVFIPKKRLRGVEDYVQTPMNRNKRLDDVIDYEEVDDELRDLLKRLLHKQPSKRITLKEVKHHPWVLRGIKDHAAWIDETDPSLQSQGKKIEVSSQEVDDAVVGLTLFDRVKSSIRRLGSVVRGRDPRKRASSNVKSGEGTMQTSSKVSGAEKEGRRSSLRGDEQIFSALRASRETSEHPLSHSVAASPEMKGDRSNCTETSTIGVDANRHTPSPLIIRPSFPERAISTAESMKTIKAPVSTIITEVSLPSSEGHIQTTTLLDPSVSSSLGGIFGGAGRRFVNSMRSRERGRGRDSASQSSRSSSVENLNSSLEDSHASPSIAFSSATAAGHVDLPPVLREERQAEGLSQPLPYFQPKESSEDAWRRAQEVNYRRDVLERERIADTRPRSATVNAIFNCPPSPDDEIFYTRQEHQRRVSQDAIIPVSSSSDDQMTSGISESFSYPSIPSVVSGASSLSAVAAEEQEKYATGTVLLPAITHEDNPMAGRREMGKGSLLDDDEAGYNGDGDEEEESDDEGIIFGGK